MRRKHRTVGPEPVSALSLAGGRERVPRKLKAAGGACGGGCAGAAPAQRSLAPVAPRRGDTGRSWKGAGRPAGAQGVEGGAAPAGGPAVRPAQMQGDAGYFCVTTGERRCDLLMRRAPQCMRLVLMKGSQRPLLSFRQHLTLNVTYSTGVFMTRRKRIGEVLSAWGPSAGPSRGVSCGSWKLRLACCESATRQRERRPTAASQCSRPSGSLLAWRRSPGR